MEDRVGIEPTNPHGSRLRVCRDCHSATGPKSDWGLCPFQSLSSEVLCEETVILAQAFPDAELALFALQMPVLVCLVHHGEVAVHECA